MASVVLLLALTVVGPATVESPRDARYESWGFEQYELVELPATRTRVALYFAGRDHENTVILVHGLGQNGVSDWQHQVPRLKKHYRVIGLDLPGFGDSTERVFDPSPETYAALIKDVVDRYGTGDVHVVGHSMGGAISVWFAGQYPDALKTLTVVDAAGILHKAALFNSWSTPPTTGGWFNLAMRRAEARLNRFKLKVLDKTHSISEILLGSAKYALPNYQQKVAMQLIDADFGEVIFGVTVPTLIVWGNADNVAPLRTALALQQILPETRLEILPAGHVPMKETPTSFNDSLLAWLDSPGSTRSTGKAPAADAEIGECKGQSGKLFQGDYSSIVIDSCNNVVLDHVQGAHVTIDGSRVLIESSYFENESSPPVTIRDSFVVITGSEFRGTVPLTIHNSRVDFAGSAIHGKLEATSTEERPARLLFSISKEVVGATAAALHGYREVAREQAAASPGTD